MLLSVLAVIIALVIPAPVVAAVVIKLRKGGD
jgi:hypothetical protein